MRGLKALSRKLAESALESLELPHNSLTVSRVESGLLHTLIREWGTLSYEFSLNKPLQTQQPNIEDSGDRLQLEGIFRAHCYFGLKKLTKTQDSLQHLKCNASYGSSTKALEFLLSELEL